MSYRVMSGRPVQHAEAGQLDAVQYALRERAHGFALAMTFDPGDAADTSLTARAVDMMLGLTHVRGWRFDGQEMRLGRASAWTDRWWARTLGPDAFVVESDLAPAGAAVPDDIPRIIGLTMLAWCLEREQRLAGRPIPDLMTAFGPDGVVLASLHPEPLREAMREQRASIIERLAALPEAVRSPTHAHVLNHLDAGGVRPWSLPDTLCTWGTTGIDPASSRVYVALEDTAEAPQPHTARTLLRLMLASGTDD